ncbi:hypothetical protein PLESTB_000209900 [Pleodorina starrii]|uniref:Uncharacterized protein n=1 Tax=Pleodorina starrii TaxID=330485 RepID=A0A9W6EYB4_9CHLO|nr:hypothetical protein PLESTB_000209900 [Pleodorina starrii]GLC73390.1 hypothetical protein PLESTF_001370100 [Pleodorina starrii]
MQNRHELQERVRSAPALQVCGAVIVAWVCFLQHVEEDECGIDPVVMEEYECMGCAPYVPEELVGVPELGRLDELELVLPQPSNVQDDGSEIHSGPWVVEDLLTGCARLIISTGSHGGRPLDEHHPAQQPLGMSYPAYCWRHLVRRVPCTQFTGNPMLLARMYDNSARQATMVQVGMALRLKPDLEHDVARLQRDAARVMGVILSLPYNHPQHRQLLVQ